MAEPTTVEEEFEFAWGKKRGMGGKRKDVQFYDSFTFDGVEYALNDAIYLHNGSGGEPHIGKLIKIWENRDKSRKVKVQWFFRPNEIRKFLEGIQTRDNELFLACGDGKGFANVNPLEAIVGKCNVCVSKDNGNPQRSDDAMAGFVSYRFFDVGNFKIVDQIDGTEEKCFQSVWVEGDAKSTWDNNELAEDKLSKKEKCGRSNIFVGLGKASSRDKGFSHCIFHIHEDLNKFF
ncbi:Protein ANTI-SILENCING 1, partial [Mucuna pruriens]